MSAAFRSHGKGTLVLKGTFAGIHIERATGSDDAKMLTNLRSMCHTLANAGRLDVLSALALGQLRLLDVWRQYRGGDWTRLPTPEHAKPLAVSLEAWRLTVRGLKHRRSIKSNFAQLGVTDRATVADAPVLLKAYRVTCEVAGTAVMFNRTRSAVSAFLATTLGQEHPLWISIRAIRPLPVRKTRKPNPQTPAQAWAIRETLGAEWGDAWWAMCCTGMGPDEMFSGKWRRDDLGLRVIGTKTLGGARDRHAPLIDTVTQPMMTQEQFQRKLQRSGLGVRPYDGRHTFKHWCDLAGIAPVRIEIYMGHETGYRMETLYGSHESERYLEQDTKRLRKVVGKVVGSKTAAPRKPNAPTRNRTENLLIKRQLASPSHTRHSRTIKEETPRANSHTPPMDPR